MTDAPTITEPGVFDLPAEVYHADPCPQPSLSSSIARPLLSKSPIHAWAAHPRLNPAYKPKDDTKFDIGTAAHHLVLGDPGQFEIIDAADFRKKAAQQARDEARTAGKVPLLADQWDAVQAMAKACRAQLDDHYDASNAFTDGKPEQTLVWREGDIWCRARIDWLPRRSHVLDDLKTIGGSAEPEAWLRHAIQMGYDIQDAFYRRGFRTLFRNPAVDLPPDPRVRFVVIETEFPHALSVVEFDERARELADQKVERAINIWRHCLQTGRWPGYGSRTAVVQVPAYHEMQWDERVDREDMAGSVRDYMDNHALHWRPIEEAKS